MEADILTKIILPLTLFVIMLGMGLSLTPKDFARVMEAPKAMMLGFHSQLVLLPLLGYLIVLLFGLEGELAVGLIILVLCPGGTTSNLMSFLARGDVALSITLTAVVSLITPFTIPLVTAIALDHFIGSSQSIELPIVITILQLLVITVIPIMVGMLMKRKWPRFAQKSESPVKLLSTVFMFIVIAGIVIKNSEHMVGFFIQVGLATFALNTIAIVLGFLIGKATGLAKPQSITLGMEVGVQNGTVALLVSGTLLANPVMTIPAVTYSLLMFVTAAVFGLIANKLG